MSLLNVPYRYRALAESKIQDPKSRIQQRAHCWRPALTNSDHSLYLSSNSIDAMKIHAPPFILLMLFFVSVEGFLGTNCKHNKLALYAANEPETSSYEETGESSKGVVSGLTDLVNFFFPEKQSEILGKLFWSCVWLFVRRCYLCWAPPFLLTVQQSSHQIFLHHLKLRMNWCNGFKMIM